MSGYMYSWCIVNGLGELGIRPKAWCWANTLVGKLWSSSASPSNKKRHQLSKLSGFFFFVYPQRELTSVRKQIFISKASFIFLVGIDIAKLDFATRRSARTSHTVGQFIVRNGGWCPAMRHWIISCKFRLLFIKISMQGQMLNQAEFV